MINPYVAGGPITDKERFFGREDIFQFIIKAFSEETRNIVFYGGRRTGKTSICFQIVNGRLGSNYLPVRLSFDEVAYTRSISEAFYKFVTNIKNQFRKHHIFSDAEFISLSDLKENPFEVFKRFLTEIIESLYGKRLVLLLDEYELIYSQIKEKNWDRKIIRFWKSLINQLTEIHFILFGTQSLFVAGEKSTKELLDIESCVSREISFLKTEEAKELIQKPAKDVLVYSPPVVEKILRLTAGHPYFTQVICRNIFNLCKDAGKKTVSFQDIEKAVQKFNENSPPHMFHIWDDFLGIEQKVVAIVCSILVDEDGYMAVPEIDKIAREKYKVFISKKRIEAVINKLVAAKFIESQDKGIRFTVDLIRHWVRGTYSAIAPQSEFLEKWRPIIVDFSLIISIILLLLLIVWLNFDPDRLSKNAEKLINQGDYPKAVNKLKAAVDHYNWFPKRFTAIPSYRLHKKLAEVYTNIDSLSLAIDEYSSAIDEYERAHAKGEIDQDSRIWKLNPNIGDLYLKKKTEDDSLKVLRYYAKAVKDSTKLTNYIIDLRAHLKKSKVLNDPKVINILPRHSTIVFDQGSNQGLVVNMQGRIYMKDENIRVYLTDFIKLYNVDEDSSHAKVDLIQQIKRDQNFLIEKRQEL